MMGFLEVENSVVAGEAVSEVLVRAGQCLKVDAVVIVWRFEGRVILCHLS
jgi:hypothetical protein